MSRKLLSLCALVLLAAPAGQPVQAEPYGPTLNEAVQRYAATRNFHKLNECLEKESIAIRLGMNARDVERWAAQSRAFKLESRKGSVYKFVPADPEATFFDLSFEVWLAKGEVVTIKTFNVNNFEPEEGDFAGLKPLKPVRVNECWVNRNYVDPNSWDNGYDFVLGTQISKPAPGEEVCMGSDRAHVVLGKPGLLYPRHVSK
ncbi:MAG: hypothetical protein II132_00230 [Desulfovibrio sp.]|nr:hypothetical protein [Desulfovibrio sp.]